MVQIHEGNNRGSFQRTVTTPAGVTYNPRWWSYDGGKPLETLKKAMAIIQKSCRTGSGCNSYFRRLTGRRSFKDVWDDPGVWIHWDPRGNPGFYGFTTTEFPVGDVTISNFSLNRGVWTTVATLVHELAHVNGASVSNMEAENALPPCGLKALFVPGAIGVQDVASGDSGSRYA